MSITIKQITENKQDLLPLLLLADESPELVATYLDRGALYGLYDNTTPVAVCVITAEDDGTYEIQNLAVIPELQGRGYGKRLLAQVCDLYQTSPLIVGTDDVSGNVQFYEKCDFKPYEVLPNYFPTHYAQPLFESGKQLIDKVYLRKQAK